MEDPNSLLAELDRDIPSSGDVYGPLLRRCADMIRGFQSTDAQSIQVIHGDGIGMDDMRAIATAGRGLYDAVNALSKETAAFKAALDATAAHAQARLAAAEAAAKGA